MQTSAPYRSSDNAIRRHLCCAASTGFLASFLEGRAAADECTVITPAPQASYTPAEALNELI